MTVQADISDVLLPMHDIGKIGIPDAILQKPGKLTKEEYEVMKQHPVIGGNIIKETFGHLFDGEYENMAFQVADVFDAVSAKRCYRDAMPLEECYHLILRGKGVDFDPDIVDAFLMNQEKVEEIYFNKTRE